MLFPHTEKVGDKLVVRVQVPCSSQVHRSGGEVFLRNEDGDYRLRDPYQIAGLVNRKLSFYTEQRVMPWRGMADLNPEFFDRARELFRQHHHSHPWLGLDNEGILRVGGFIRKNPLSAETGYTLAAALMFGTDATIQQAGSGVYNVSKYLPHYTPGATPLFEELNDIFSATIQLPGEQATPGVTPEVTPEVVSMLLVIDGEMSRREIMRRLGLHDEKHFREHYLQRAVKTGVIELTIPEKPQSRLQKYRLTAQGQETLQSERQS